MFGSGTHLPDPGIAGAVGALPVPEPDCSYSEIAGYIHGFRSISPSLVAMKVAVAEEAITIRPGDGGFGYQIAALVCLVVFADNLLRRIEGPGENM
jgi:hypothetical protein